MPASVPGNRASLGWFLALARRGDMPSGWLYFRPGEITADSECMLVEDDEAQDHVEQGFTREGLDDDLIAMVIRSARVIEDPPDESLLVEAFNYYLAYDAYLSARGDFARANAAPKASFEESLLAAERQFYDRLGKERPKVGCAEPGCGRGAIELGSRCRPHHFAMLRGRPCPFSD
jgi:hypothetical protein